MSQLVFVHGPGIGGCAAGSVRFDKPIFWAGFISGSSRVALARKVVVILHD